MMRKLLSLFAVALLGGSLAVAVGSPAQAWGYCSPIPSINGRFNWYRSQGYCGTNATVTIRFDPCYNFSDTAFNDWSAAVWNRTTYDVTIFQADNCSYAYTWYDVPAGTSDPDLYNNSMYRNASSMKFWPQ